MSAIGTVAAGTSIFPAFLLNSVLTLPSPPPWRAVRTRFGRESVVSLGLERYDFETRCARYRSRWLVRGRWHERLSVFIPGYVFSRFDPADPHRWHEVMDLDGVVEILPGTVTEGEMDLLDALLVDFVSHGDEPVFRVSKRFLPIGGEVTIAEGPFATYRGLVEDCDGFEADVKIFGLLGRDLSVKVPTEWCHTTLKNEVDAISGRRSYPEGTRRRRGRARRANR